MEEQILNEKEDINNIMKGFFNGLLSSGIPDAICKIAENSMEKNEQPERIFIDRKTFDKIDEAMKFAVKYKSVATKVICMNRENTEAFIKFAIEEGLYKEEDFKRCEALLPNKEN